MEKSYVNIARSTSMIGGAMAVSYVIGLLRVKAVAVLLGPSGVGTIGVFSSVSSFIGTVAAFGIDGSAVREIAKYKSEDNSYELAKSAKLLKRVGFLTGVLGWFVAIFFSTHISIFVFGDDSHAASIAILGGVVFLNAVSGCQMAVIRGMRYIREVAKITIYSSIIGSIISVTIYYYIGEDGIIISLAAVAFGNLALTYVFLRRIPIEDSSLSLKHTIGGVHRLIGLGIALMWSGLSVAATDMIIRSVVTQYAGLEGAGYYQAAWALSGLFADFILKAMFADFYPNLTGSISNRCRARELVNEQIEIGVLFAMPGLILTLLYAPSIVVIVYSREFSVAETLLPWLTIGVFGRIVSWPIGTIQLAMGASRWFTITQTVQAVLHVGLALALVPAYGVIGAAYAFAAMYFVSSILVLWIGNRLINFQLSAVCGRLLAVALGFIFAAVFAARIEGRVGVLVGITLTMACGVYCLIGLSRRLGSEHWLVRPFMIVPVLRSFL